jgi:TPP-dependent pyruvate/acetoin dehydrogenase alpha subunit
LTPATWRSILVSAAGLELPILFVVLGRKASQKKEAERAEVCNTARAAGVPAIPVDACDAVALYRVTQESLGRTRSGDGPVLIEAVSWRVEGTRGGVDDPVEHLKDFLVGRKICSPAWFEQIAKTTRGQRLAPR